MIMNMILITEYLVSAINYTSLMIHFYTVPYLFVSAFYIMCDIAYNDGY